MAILWVLIPLSFILMGLAIWAFFWAVDHQQLDNLDTASQEALELPSDPDNET